MSLVDVINVITLMLHLTLEVVGGEKGRWPDHLSV